LAEKKKYWYVARARSVGAEVCDMLNRLPFEHFVPMMQKKVKIGGKEVKRDAPLALNYVFFRTDDFMSLQRIVRDLSRVHLIYMSPMRDAKPNSEQAKYKPMIASDHEMEMFMKAASFYAQGAPLSVPNREMMQKGDTVRIIDGPFKGVEGILTSHQGKDGGKVIVSISNLISISTIDIAPENIQVIKFAHGNKHIYKKMDSFTVRLNKAILKHEAGEELPGEEKEAIETFIRRFSGVQTDTINTEAKLNMLIMQGYLMLQMNKEAKKYRLKLRDEILPKVKSEKMKEKIKKVIAW
jgi:transcription antitermination factor NusG